MNDNCMEKERSAAVGSDGFPKKPTVHKVKDIQGQRFTRLVVVAYGGLRQYRGHAQWICKCDCGRWRCAPGAFLVNGYIKSCGCLRGEQNRVANLQHGQSRHPKPDPIYRCWDSLIQRCTNAKTKAFPDYGGRGITVCKRWRESFSSFFFDMGPRPTPQHTIERVDNNKGYFPSNCRWATRREQQQNRRRNHLLTLGNRTQCLTAWAREINMRPARIAWRLRKGWSVARALTQ